MYHQFVGFYPDIGLLTIGVWLITWALLLSITSGSQIGGKIMFKVIPFWMGLFLLINPLMDFLYWYQNK